MVEIISSYLRVSARLDGSNKLVLPLGLSCLAAVFDFSNNFKARFLGSLSIMANRINREMSVSLDVLKGRLERFLHGLTSLADLVPHGGLEPSYRDNLTIFYGLLILVLIRITITCAIGVGDPCGYEVKDL